MEYKLLISCAIIAMVHSATAKPGSGPKKYRQFLSDFAWMLETNATLRSEYEQRVAEQEGVSLSTAKFNCDVSTTAHTPKNVHELRPGDIKVIAAMGDSITAGNGIDAWTAIGVLREKRGESWSIGGDKTLEKGVVTIANILRKYNPNLLGYSTGYGEEDTISAWFNVAVAGAKAEDLPAEADMLVEKMKADPRVDFQNDWKLITLLIGGNDLCDYCDDRKRFSPEMFGKHLKTTLDKLHAQIPRALVNLLPMADITPVPEIKTGPLCTAIHWGLCDCALNDLTSFELRPIQLQFYEQMKSLANGGRYDTKDDFTVVLQPHLVDQHFPRDPKTGEYDPSYIAPDCFHPNRKSHHGLAWLLWNGMLTPVGQKVLSTNVDNLQTYVFKCPTKDHPYIFTNKNSPKP